MAELIFIKLGMHIMTPEPISTAYFISPLPSVRLSECVSPLITDRQRLSKIDTAATNTQL
jgi:hypothetical protein